MDARFRNPVLIKAGVSRTYSRIKSNIQIKPKYLPMVQHLRWVSLLADGLNEPIQINFLANSASKNKQQINRFYQQRLR
jgi:hypothetical protein